MDFTKTPEGTRGAIRRASSTGLSRRIKQWMEGRHRRKGDTFMGMDLLYLTTVGAMTGQRRRTPLARFPDGPGWLVVASLAGASNHPAWYHNIAAHPDQVWAEVSGTLHHVVIEQLEGTRREEAWQRIVTAQPRYAKYQAKTDRVLPIIRLVPQG